jgi:hypothetical protein
MEFRPQFQIQVVLKALLDVVLPAVDPNNKLAQEQAQLVIGTLQIVAQRLSLLYRYDREELTRFLSLAAVLQKQARDLPGAEKPLQALAGSVAVGADVLERARAEPGELEAANFDLRDRIGTLIAEIYAGSHPRKLSHISATIMTHAGDQLLRERSWLIAQGWEADPKSVPAIETLLGPCA